MPSIARPRPVSVWIRLARSAGRMLSFALRVVVVGLAMGVAPPSLVEKLLRHDDPIVQVEEEKEP